MVNSGAIGHRRDRLQRPARAERGRRRRSRRVRRDGRRQPRPTAVTTGIDVGGASDYAATGGVVTIVNTGTIATTGNSDNAIYAQSVGGGGGDAGFGLGLGLTTASKTALAVFGRRDGDTQSGGGIVGVGNGANLTTKGSAAYGLLAQSIGGGGGERGVLRCRPAPDEHPRPSSSQCGSAATAVQTTTAARSPWSTRRRSRPSESSHRRSPRRASAAVAAMPRSPSSASSTRGSPRSPESRSAAPAPAWGTAATSPSPTAG